MNDDIERVVCHFPSDKYSKDYLSDFEYALENKCSYSFTRIGDGEITLILGTAKYGIGYNGIALPNPIAQMELRQSIKESDLVGVFDGDPEWDKVKKMMNYEPQHTCYAFDNLFLPMNPRFCKLLLNYKVLLVGGGVHGRNGKMYSDFIHDKWGVRMDYVTNIQNYSMIKQCIDEISKKDFEICLISAGACANILCTKLKNLIPGKLYIDAGHQWDNILAPEYKDYFLLDKSKII